VEAGRVGFNPELLLFGSDRPEWMTNADLRLYRFAIENLGASRSTSTKFGEKLMSLPAGCRRRPYAYAALSTADARSPRSRSQRDEVTVSYGQYARSRTRHEQADREKVFTALHETYRPRSTPTPRSTTLCASATGSGARAATSARGGAARRQHPDPRSRNPIETTRRRGAAAPVSAAPADLNVPSATSDFAIRSSRSTRNTTTTKCSTGSSTPWPPGPAYQALMRQGSPAGGSTSRTRASGPASLPVYGIHPYMLLNYTDTLDDMFTLAHEMGHSMHTILSHEAQPFIYSDYTIFVAEVPSTLSEALLLEFMLEHSTDPTERIVLLQHAIDNITGTFFTQVMFADFELRAHRLAEQDQPITAEILTETYTQLLKDYYGDAIDMNPFTGITWSRIPHFFNSPYYVYQYATCFASAAKIAKQIMAGGTESAEARQRFLALLRSGGSDYPMELLRRAGVDLSQPDTVLAVVDQLDGLVTRLEHELDRRA
jgi:oligoendopeptidase F